MIKIVTAIAASLVVLSGCTTAQRDDTFGIVCASVSTADTAFQIYASSGKVSAKVIDAERKAVAAAQAVCNGPRPDNVVTALAAVNRALAALAEATRQARIETTRKA